MGVSTTPVTNVPNLVGNPREVSEEGVGTQPFITYGLDIEIDTTDGAVDPDLAPIRAIGLSGRGFDQLYAGDEARMLRDLDHQLRELAPGVLATWNGSMFDLPYLARRAHLLSVDLDLVLVADPAAARGRRPLPGHPGGYRAAWGPHRHLDTFLTYGDITPPAPWSSLIGRRRRRGLIADTGDLLNEALHAHAANDARLARVLTERRGIAALRSVDQIESVDPEATAPDRHTDPTVPLRPAIAGL